MAASPNPCEAAVIAALTPEERSFIDFVAAMDARVSKLAEKAALARRAEAWQGEADSLARERDALREQLATVKAKHDALRSERDALRDAARALLADLEDPDGDPVLMCSECRSLAMIRSKVDVCEGHDPGRGSRRDLSYATPLRALRKLCYPNREAR